MSSNTQVPPLNALATIHLRYLLETQNLQPDVELAIREELARRGRLMDGLDRWQAIPISPLGKGTRR